MPDRNLELGVPPTPEEVADLLRSCEFAMSHALSAAIAVGGRELVESMKRDLDSLLEVNRQVRAMLKRLPPKPPMTPERMEKVGAVVAAVLDKRFGEGSQDAITAAVEAAWPEVEPAPYGSTDGGSDA